MPFEILRNDITRMSADVIVNTANPRPEIGSGTDAAIHQAAGERLLAARRQIGNIERGCCAVTPAYNLKAKYVIHTVGPVWEDGSWGEEMILRQCYDRSLAMADDLGCSSIAFPLISSGNYGFPKELALETALDAFRTFLKTHEMDIKLVVFDRESVKISETLHDSIEKYVDEHYVSAKFDEEYAPMPGSSSNRRRRRIRDRYDAYHPSLLLEDDDPYVMAAPSYQGTAAVLPCQTDAASSLNELLERTDAGFSETLLRLIDESGKKDPEVYKKANLSKAHFSKIRKNPDYRPKKQTAVAFAIALELDLEQAKDLIGRAGYALNNSSKFDIIVTWFINHRQYDLYKINLTLFEFDQPLLGAF